MILLELFLPSQLHTKLFHTDWKILNQPLTAIFQQKIETLSKTTSNLSQEDDDITSTTNTNSNIIMSKGHQKKTSPSKDSPLPPAVLVYHESARSIVFRDDLRRQRNLLESSSSNSNSSDSNQESIANFTPIIQPLPLLELGPGDEFLPLSQSANQLDVRDNDENDSITEEERWVLQLLRDEQATVKTIRNVDWTAFLNRFYNTDKKSEKKDGEMEDGPSEITSFRSSTSLL